MAPIKKETFSQVLTNCEDQVLVRRLLEAFVPVDIQQRITDEFNLAMKERHRERIETGIKIKTPAGYYPLCGEKPT